MMDDDRLDVSPFDTDREYDVLTLANGLEVLLVRDAATEEAACCMCVMAGAFLDPYPGVAHLLEHMLFLASVKYPELSAYQDFVSRHSGRTNAFTSSEHTTFYFQIPNASFGEAMDRFAQFFAGPSFVPSAVEREIKAVNSEHTKNLQSDGWRMLQLTRSSASTSTPYNHFATGSEETLWTEPRKRGVDPVETIKAFHARYYSPNVMKLCVVSAEPLDAMRASVTALFGAIPNTNVVIPPVPSDAWPVSGADCGRVFRVVPTSTSSTLRMTWSLPESTRDYKYGAGHYLSHCVGHESSGSILAELKRLGWANQLMAGEFETATSFIVFGVEIDLTDEGMALTDDIVALVMEYLAMLRERGPSHAIFKEIGALNQQAFLFAEKREPSDHAVAWASNMGVVGRARRHYLHGAVMELWDPARIVALLDLLTIQRVNVFLRSPQFAGKLPLRERWYGTEYAVEQLSADLTKRCDDIRAGVAPRNAHLHEPQPNPFVSSDFSLLPVTPADAHPELLCDDRFCQVWCKRDAHFRKPVAQIILEIRSPFAYNSPENAALCALFCLMLDDALKPLSYHAELAGLSFKILNTDNGIFISTGGFSHKLPLLLVRVLEVMEHAARPGSASSLIWDRFPAIREAQLRRYKNFDLVTDAYKRAQYYQSLPVQSPRWTQDEYAEVLQHIDAAQLQRYIPQLLSQVYFRALLAGNLADPWRVTDRVRRVLFSGGATHMSQMQASVSRRMVKLPKGKVVFDRAAGSPTDSNNAMNFTFQIGADSIPLACTLDAFNALVANPIFAELRGQQQLGYVVMSFTRRELGVLSWAVLVQTDRRMELAEALVLDFVDKAIGKILDDTSAEEFAETIQSLVAVARQMPQSLSEEATEIWGFIDDYSLMFKRRAAVAAHFESGAVTLAAIKQFYVNYVAPRAPGRRLLITRVHAGLQSKPTSTIGIDELARPVPAARDHDVAAHVLDDVGEFRRTRPLYAGIARHRDTQAKL